MRMASFRAVFILIVPILIILVYIQLQLSWTAVNSKQKDISENKKMYMKFMDIWFDLKVNAKNTRTRWTPNSTMNDLNVKDGRKSVLNDKNKHEILLYFWSNFPRRK